MAIFSVYLPPEHAGKSDAENFRLLKDSKAPLALIFPPFWLAWHRLWVELIIYAAVAIAISLLAAWQPLPPVLYLSAIPGLYLLLEGNELVRRKLERDGWTFAGVVDAHNRDEAEIKFMVDNEAELSAPKPIGKRIVAKHRLPVLAATAPAGLFPE